MGRRWRTPCTRRVAIRSSTAASDVWVAANRYQDASELAFHLPDQPTVFALNLASRRNQYDLWDTAHDRVRPGDGLVVAFEATPQGDSLADVVGTWFRDHRAAATVDLTRDGGVVTQRQHLALSPGRGRAADGAR